ncbi:hypothetical protein [Microbacterium invictum]|uniref:Uncharacterized protein n=1 Tax=Microbacterium invictum TaxID=515415 RepID=A0ABZ0VBM2_9MICO|nr:hypothetical protein [Microbacterium invictum]WQB70874.1 hypothetical protein T9R20_02635 [Microbacterium invictum]
MTDSLQSRLAAADPVDTDVDARLNELVRDVVAATEAEATTASPSPAPWWKRRRITIPIGVAGVLALTGAAFVLPLDRFGVGGITVDADVVIPISYTTDTGVDVDCRYAIYYGDPTDRTESDERLAAFMVEQDWSGVGQRMYVRAIANPFVPGRDGGLQSDTQANRDQMSLSIAISDVIEEIIPDDLRDNREGLIESSVTDCQGKLH